MQFPAPDDWNEQTDGYCVLLACIPNSEKWRALYRGQFYQPTWWKYYDKDGPPFNPVIQIAKNVLEGLCMANCDDIVTALNRIADALDGNSQGPVNLGDMVQTLDDIKQYLDQLETIQNNAVTVMGGVVETVLPGGP